MSEAGVGRDVSCSDEKQRVLPESLAAGWRVRPMRQEDIERCLEIWLMVELTEAHVTVANALRMDPAGFYVAELKSNGRIIGMCAGVMATSDTAFMGFYAVEPQYQGIGVGRELWARTVARLDSSSSSSPINVGLYGVPNMSEKYKKSGFKVEDSIRMLILESKPGEQLQIGGLMCLDEFSRDTHDKQWQYELIAGSQLCNDEMMLAKLIEYDGQVLEHSRDELLRDYLREADELPLTVALIRRFNCNEGDGSTCSRKNADIVDTSERKVSCCSSGAGQQQTSGEEGEQLSSQVAAKCSLSSSDIAVQDRQLSDGSLNDCTASDSAIEMLGYGCIRHDNTGGAMLGPVYANSNRACEVILRALIERFSIAPGGKYSAMSLTSNEQADRLLRQIGFEELDQCSRMFTKFIPEAQLDQIYYVHSPNFALF